MGKALYRKYRSKSLDELVGQEHIVTTLKRAIATNRISHAYLFTGPRGVGKTSVARLLAHELNGVPYTGEDSHLDIIEIDAASSGGVDEIRALREKVYISPSSGKYKIYIIDEVHMMTTSAFNALLKTLEEPPEHTIFILATTEAHKLPATIVSRTQRFTFKPISREKVIGHLKHIAKEENIKVSDDALELIAEHGEGSFRDSISMLDQASSSNDKIERTDVERLLGIPPNKVTTQLLESLENHDQRKLITMLAELKNDGYQAAGVAKQLAQALRTQLLDGTAKLNRATIIKLLERLIDVPASHQPDQLLELILLDIAIGGNEQPTPAQAESEKPKPKIEEQKAEKPKAAEVTKVSTTSKAEEEPIPAEPVATIDAAPGGTIDEKVWQALLIALKRQYNTLYGIVRMARPDFSPGHITLTFGFIFHQKRANDPKNKKIITSMLEEITGLKISIECLYDKTVTPPSPVIEASAAESVASASTSSALGTISNIFGGGELLKP